MGYVDEEVMRTRELQRGESMEFKFGPPSTGPIQVTVQAFRDWGVIDFPDASFPRAWILVELLDGAQRRVAQGEGTVTFEVSPTPVANPGPDWTVRITNNGNRAGKLRTTIAFTGYRPLLSKDIPFKSLNEKLGLIFTDPPPIKIVLRNKTVEWRRNVRGVGLQIRTDPPPANDNPPWTPIVHTMVHFEASPAVQLVYGHQLDDIDLGKLVLDEGTIETTEISVNATIHDGQFALKTRVRFKSNDAHVDGKDFFDIDIGIKDGLIQLFLVLRIDDNGRPQFRVLPHADVGAYHWVLPDAQVRWAVRGAIEEKLEQTLTRKYLDPIAQACMTWILGDRDLRLINRRYDMQLRYAGEEVGPVVATDEQPQAPIAQGRLEAVKNIVVLMMENRSFDNMLGFLTLEGRTDVDGIRLDMSNPIFPTNERKTVFRLTETHGMVDPGHGFAAQRNQRGNYEIDVPGPLGPLGTIAFRIPPWGGFIYDYQRRCRLAGLSAEEVKERRFDVMGFYGRNEVPVYGELADEFTICDRWFASHPGSTWPNRFISTTGQLSRGTDGRPQIDNPDLATFDPLDTKSIFDHLDGAGVDWRYFEHDYCFGRLFERFTNDPRIVNIDDAEQGFWAAARAGTLPPVTYIEPSLTELPPGNDDHAPSDIRAGQTLIQNIYNALRDSPQWPGTLFIITYDEHGGFFDHVHNESGKTTALCDDPDTGEPVTHFGMRVPTLVVSPLVRQRFCSREEFDHCSILKTIIQTFLHTRPPDMGPRVAAARSLESLLDRPLLDRRRITLALPKAVVPEPRGERDTNDFHALMTRLHLRRRGTPTRTPPTRTPPVRRDHRS